MGKCLVFDIGADDTPSQLNVLSTAGKDRCKELGIDKDAIRELEDSRVQPEAADHILSRAGAPRVKNPSRYAGAAAARTAKEYDANVAWVGRENAAQADGNTEADVAWDGGENDTPADENYDANAAWEGGENDAPDDENYDANTAWDGGENDAPVDEDYDADVAWDGYDGDAQADGDYDQSYNESL